MESNFYQQLENSSAFRKSRDLNCELVLENCENLKIAFDLAFDHENKKHYKAWWCLELVLKKELLLINPYLDFFSATISKYKHDSAIRPISKICMFIAKSKTIPLKEKQEKQIIEACLDWLIQEERVATKAYAIRALYEFSKKHIWIKEELKTILTQNYPLHSYAYQAVAREILKKLK